MGCLKCPMRTFSKSGRFLEGHIEIGQTDAADLGCRVFVGHVLDIGEVHLGGEIDVFTNGAIRAKGARRMSEPSCSVNGKDCVYWYQVLSKSIRPPTCRRNVLSELSSTAPWSQKAFSRGRSSLSAGDSLGSYSPPDASRDNEI